MSNKTMYPSRSPQRDRVSVNVSFQCNGAGAPLALKGNATLYTVAKTSTGVYTITFTDGYNDLDAAIPGFQAAAASNVCVQLGSWNSTAKTLVVRLQNTVSGTVENVAADANNRVFVSCTFRNTLQNA